MLSSKIKNVLLIFYLFFLSSCFLNKSKNNNTQSTILEINSIKQAHDMLQKVDTKTLVVFDCDDTLTIPVDKLARGWMRGTKDFKKLSKNLRWHVFWRCLSKLDFSYILFLEGRVYEEISFQLVEENIRDEINALQKREVKVIALTFQETGRVGEIERFEQWRFKKLGLLGIDFSSSFVEQDLKLDALSSCRGNYPGFYRGILCANRIAKGKVLGAFLDKITWKPERVIFFDDDKKYVDSVAQEMQKRSISFYGYVYHAASRLSQAIDPEIAQFQLEYLKKHEEWISDDQAAYMLREEKFKKRIQKSVSQ